MIAMGMMQMTIDEVVYVITMWNGFMAAIWAVNVGFVMAGANMIWRARIWIGLVDF